MSATRRIRTAQAVRRLLIMGVIGVLGGSAGVNAQAPHDEAQVRYRVALRAIQDDNPRIALAELTAALGLDPNHVLAHYTFAVVSQTASPAEALTHLNRAIELGLPEKELAASSDLRVEILYALARVSANETYADPDTGLMWTATDNGDDIDWKTSTEYCSNLTLRGFDNWRLPTINELENMSHRSVPDFHKIRKPLKLSGCCVWSSTKASRRPVLFAFNFGQPWPYDGPPVNTRALCVRAAK